MNNAHPSLRLIDGGLAQSRPMLSDPPPLAFVDINDRFRLSRLHKRAAHCLSLIPNAQTVHMHVETYGEDT